MKKIILLLFVMFSLQSFSQDTTAFNLIGVNTDGGLDYFYDDSTSMGSLTFSSDFAVGYSIFQNPVNGELYSILYDDVLDPSGARNLYRINPISGTYTLIKTFNNQFINSADIAPDETIYFITGNGNSTNPNSIFTFNLTTGVEALVSNPIMDGSRGLEFNTLDSSLYLFEGYQSTLSDYTEKLYTLNLLTNQADTFNTTGLYDEIHGALYDSETNTFIISAYGGEMYTTDNTYLNGTFYHNLDDGVTGNSIMDIEKVKFIEGAATRGYCLGDSVQIKAYFGGSNYKWFINGIEISGIIDTFIYASSPGIYRALMEVNMNEQLNYIWSEAITVTQFAMPNVTISSPGNDTEICPSETITLTGASGGTLQWYYNNAPISGANASTYGASQVGIYNQMKTNSNGCSDTSHVDFVITADPNCVNGLNEINANSFNVYPNPTSAELTIVSSYTGTVAYSILDLTGKVVMKGDLVGATNSINIKSLNTGIYLFTLNGITKRIIKK